MIDGFTKDADFIQASQLTSNTKLSGATVASYLRDNLDRPKTFERLFKIALRADGTPISDELCSGLIKSLRDYNLRNKGAMPRSFDKLSMSKLYLNLKSGQVEMSPKLEELVLFTMDKLGMDAEIFDHCDAI